MTLFQLINNAFLWTYFQLKEILAAFVLHGLFASISAHLYIGLVVNDVIQTLIITRLMPRFNHKYCQEYSIT